MGGGSFFQFEPDPGSNEENFVSSSLNQIETEEFLVGVEFRGQMGASGRDPSSLSCQTPLHPCDTRPGGRTCENILPLMGRPCWRTCENPRVTRGGQNISKLRLSLLVSFGLFWSPLLCRMWESESTPHDSYVAPRPKCNWYIVGVILIFWYSLL